MPKLTIDLESTTLTLPTGSAVQFPMEAFARYCLLNGVDELGFLLERIGDIQRYERGTRVMKAQIAVLGGDGIGPEVIAEGVARAASGRRARSATTSS